MSIKRNNSIDVLRIVASFFVICIHITFFCEDYIRPVIRLAVPAFFMISGYFYANVSFKTKKKRIKNIFFLTLTSNLAYFVFDIIMAISKSDVEGFFLESFTTEKWINFLIFNESMFSVHLWYLGALLYCMLIDLGVTKLRIKNGIIVFSIVVLLIFNLVLGKYSLLVFNRPFFEYTVRNFIFTGLPYFYIGKLLYSFDISKIKLGKPVFVLFFVFFCITLYTEIFIIHTLDVNAPSEQYISSIFIALTIFLFVLKYPMPYPEGFGKALASAGEKYSLAIYIIHPMIIKTIAVYSSEWTGFFTDVYTYCGPVFIFVLALLFSVVYYRIKSIIMSLRKRAH